MSEHRQKTHSILLRAGGKTLASLDLYPSAEWPEKTDAAGLWRVRINDVWHCPAGKYSFLTPAAVGELAAALLAGEEAAQEEPAPYLPWKAQVRVYLGDAPEILRGFVHAPPHQERDGRWHVWVWAFGKGPVKLPCGDVQLLRVR